ncbi:unnamed protein product, partial [Staurois parvus]
MYVADSNKLISHSSSVISAATAITQSAWDQTILLNQQKRRES